MCVCVYAEKFGQKSKKRNKPMLHINYTPPLSPIRILLNVNHIPHQQVYWL